MDWLKKRLQEPSTWKGVGWMLVAVGVLPIGSVDGVVAVGTALIGLVEIARKEPA